MMKLLFFLFCALLCGSLSAADKPNIIVILADDLGYGDLGCYGATKIPTPHSDKLAQGGMLFRDAHSASAVCSPTRYSTLTGRYSWRSWLKNWVVHDHMPLLIDTKRVTLPKMLQQQGYTTGCIGKWHLGWGTDINADWNKAVKPGPNQVGFDYYFGPPIHPYTQALLNSAPSLDPDHRELVALGGDVPSPINPPDGCRFHGRCPKVMSECKTDEVPFYEVKGGHCRCFLFKEG